MTCSFLKPGEAQILVQDSPGSDHPWFIVSVQISSDFVWTRSRRKTVSPPETLWDRLGPPGLMKGRDSTNASPHRSQSRSISLAPPPPVT
ncbi:uncharacterized protein V6R79_004787 [Siganus canaliculatus]